MANAEPLRELVLEGLDLGAEDEAAAGRDLAELVGNRTLASRE
jgi:hypothetical protein